MTKARERGSWFSPSRLSTVEPGKTRAKATRVVSGHVTSGGLPPLLGGLEDNLGQLQNRNYLKTRTIVHFAK